MEPIYIPAYVSKARADAEFDRLWNQLDWVQRDQTPRREYWMNNPNIPYTYGSGEFARTYAAQRWDDFIRSLMFSINEDFDIMMDCCFVNGYEHERHSLGFHADDSPEMRQDHPIIVVSLGAERDIETKENESGEKKRYLLGHGSIFMMPARFQQTHQHRIPKASRKVPPRISLTYRALVQ